ncbi:unnamed protein product [Miscanthus lutarioriparius]|uniref:Uncharacterized protein n=1 Tax=Miscanthus lutarioriparius TaxID=422564 RepID=A0A811QL44_9POAL|nr:unnamed protein product [Miscanthus lutarioriparius]
MSGQFKISKDNSTDWGTEKPTGEATVSGQPAEMDTWADKGAKMDSGAENTWDKRKEDGGDGAWEKKSDDGHGIWEHPSNWNGQSLNVDQDTWGNARGKNKADGNAWNAGDGIGRPNAKSNAGSSWGEKDKMESDEHLKVPKEPDTWNIGKSNESPWDNTDALQESDTSESPKRIRHI